MIHPDIYRLALRAPVSSVMENQEKWMELCALAAKEQDPAKLLQLSKEIIRLLDEKDARLKSRADSQKPQT